MGFEVHFTNTDTIETYVVTTRLCYLYYLTIHLTIEIVQYIDFSGFLSMQSATKFASYSVANVIYHVIYIEMLPTSYFKT